MRLLEAIIAANHAATEGRVGEVRGEDLSSGLPLAALTCMDARLNKFFPGMLGLPEEQFIWLRNAGNVVTSSTSSTVRSLAIAVFLKGARELAVIGHSECRMSKLTMMDLLDRLQVQGIDRNRLPMPNLQEFFGLFSSETQNVIKAVGYIRQSPIIPPTIPVHGLLINTGTGRLEWVVNGYEAPAHALPGGAALKDFVTSHLPAGTPSIVSNALGDIAEKGEPLIAKQWDSAMAKIGEEVAEHTSAAKSIPPPVPPRITFRPTDKKTGAKSPRWRERQ